MTQYTSPQSFAKISHNQEAVFTTKDSTFATIWEIEHVDPKIRFEMVGEKVRVNEELLIKHTHTCNWLGSENGKLYNIYGNELEVYCNSHLDNKKSQNLIAERVGRVTGDTPLRGQEKQNSWVLIGGQRECDEYDEDQNYKSIKVEDILNGISAFLRNKGVYGLRGLRQMFKQIDANNSGALEPSDLKWGLRNCGIQLMDDEINVLITSFDANKDGVLQYQEFVQALNVIFNFFKTILEFNIGSSC